VLRAPRVGSQNTATATARTFSAPSSSTSIDVGRVVEPYLAVAVAGRILDLLVSNALNDPSLGSV